MGTVIAFATETAFAKTSDTRVVVLTVILPDASRLAFSYEELEKLSAHTADLFNKPCLVVDLYQLVNQADFPQATFSSITFEGIGSLTLRFDQASEIALYLDEGTVNFFSGKIPVDDWPRDIVLIIIH